MVLVVELPGRDRSTFNQIAKERHEQSVSTLADLEEEMEAILESTMDFR